MNMEDRLKETSWQEPLHAITMPDALKEGCHTCIKEKSRSFRMKYVALPMTVMALVLVMLSSTTAYAAYQVRQHKTLRVFFDTTVTQAQIDAIGSQIDQMEGVSVCRYVTADMAWDEFLDAYFPGEGLEESFDDNPLADSANYEVDVLLTANTQSVIDEISAMNGVRLVSTLADLEEDTNTEQN